MLLRIENQTPRKPRSAGKVAKEIKMKTIVAKRKGGYVTINLTNPAIEAEWYGGTERIIGSATKNDFEQQYLLLDVNKNHLAQVADEIKKLKKLGASSTSIHQQETIARACNRSIRLLKDVAGIR